MIEKTARLSEKTRRTSYDAVVVGAGPNGLAAAIVLSQSGLSVLMVEANGGAGGGCRSSELTLPGFVHDVCSSVYPLGLGSPFFRKLPLAEHGLSWIHPEAPLAHPFPDGQALFLERSVEKTAQGLGSDGPGYLKLMSSLAPDWDKLCQMLLNPPRLGLHPLGAATFGLKALTSTSVFARRHFKTETARALFAGVSAHSSLSMDSLASTSFGLVLTIAAHALGWPVVRGGAQALSDALLSLFLAQGGEFVAGFEVRSISQLPPSRLVLLDVTPRQLLAMAGDKLPQLYRYQLSRYRYGPAAFKIDWALDMPVPWLNPSIRRAATVHLGATLDEIRESEHCIWRGSVSERPYVIIVQSSLADPSRAPSGKHTLWGYCHVPNGWREDATDLIESQIERFAPGFKEIVLARHVTSPAAFENYNLNYIGGDINGGALNLSQLFLRPVARVIPYATPVPGLYLCSSSTPPGGGVHGMCGYYAAHCALRNWR